MNKVFFIYYSLHCAASTTKNSYYFIFFHSRFSIIALSTMFDLILHSHSSFRTQNCNYTKKNSHFIKKKISKFSLLLTLVFNWIKTFRLATTNSFTKKCDFVGGWKIKERRQTNDLTDNNKKLPDMKQLIFSLYFTRVWI